MWILLWIFSALLGSVSYISRKKSMSFYLWDNLTFKWIGFFLAPVVVVVTSFTFWMTPGVFSDVFFMLWVLAAAAIWLWSALLQIHVTKNEKLSQLLPYWELDKIFTVVIGFVFASFLWWEQPSNITVWIALWIIVLSTIFSLYSNSSWWKLSFSKNILLFILYKFIKWALTIFIAYLLINFSSIDYYNVWVMWWALIVVWTLFISWRWFTGLFSQSQNFYKYRLTASLLQAISFIWSLFIIESMWVVVWTLIWFMAILFNILAMKYILHDNPSREKVVFAFTVVLLISIGYYFK